MVGTRMRSARVLTFPEGRKQVVIHKKPNVYSNRARKRLFLCVFLSFLYAKKCCKKIQRSKGFNLHYEREGKTLLHEFYISRNRTGPQFQ